MFGCLISDILENFTGCVTIIMGDVTYGACCIDDITTQKLGADFLIHYGHSCLVPITECCTKVLYVFVEINIDLDHFTKTILLNFSNK
jgi:2-(3-amino-3-carboxypropyl)histidine synthase